MLDTLTLEIERQARERGLEEYIEVYRTIIETPLPDTVDAIFLVPNTEGNQESIFAGAYELWKRGVSNRFLIMEGAEANGYPGSEKWYNEFAPRVKGANVEIFPNPDPYKVNTLTKFQVLGPYAWENGLSSIIVVPAPFHLVRVEMTAASVEIRMVKEGKGPAVKYYAYPGGEQEWDEVVLHSQGIREATRRDFVGIELGQIRHYQTHEYGGLISIEPTEKILKYLEGLKK